MKESFDKRQMSDLIETEQGYDYAGNYLLNLFLCIWLPILMIPIVFSVQTAFDRSIMIGLGFGLVFILVLLVGFAFIKTRIFAAVFQEFKISKKWFGFESVLFVACLVLSVVVLLVEILFWEYGDKSVLDAAIWIGFKVVLLLCAIIVSWIIMAISYEKHRKIFRRVLRARRQSGQSYKSNSGVDNTKLSISMIRLSFVVVTVVPFIFFGDSSGFWLGVLIYPIVSFVVYAVLNARHNRVGDDSPSRFLNFQNLAYIICLVFAIVFAGIFVTSYANNSLDFVEADWFVVCKIIVSAFVLVVAISFAWTSIKLLKDRGGSQFDA